MAAHRLDPGALDALVEAARAGSRPAFGALWQHLSPAVAGYVRGRGARDADDVTSEVFLAAFQKLPQFSGDGAAFRRWLFTIAHHRAVDDVRAQVRRAVEDPYDPELDARSTAPAEDEALARVGAADTLALLDRLPADQREVLLLRLVADLPVADAAVVLDRSPEAVRQLQARALARLRRILAATDPVTPPGTDAIAQA